LKPVFVILFLLSRAVFFIKADTIPFFYSGFQVHYGYIIPHSEFIRAVSHTKPYGFEISRNRIHTSYGEWKVFNAYWISGVEAAYFNFQNPEVLGYVFTISAFAEPVLFHGSRYFITIRSGGGLSYHSKIYDPVENPANMFFSTRISFPLYAAARFKYRIGCCTYLLLSGSYNHISNGGIKLPNKGMNFPTMTFGVERFQGKPPELNDNFYSYHEVRKPAIFLTIQALTTLRVMSSEGVFPQKAYYVFGMHTRITKPLGSKYALNAGAEIICDGYIKETLRRTQTNLDYKRFAITFGQDFLLGKVIFTQYCGFYLYSPNKARKPFYQKYELAYKIYRNILFGIYLKSHLGVAESMGVTFSYQIFANKKILTDQK
jgi:hypothetical protein